MSREVVLSSRVGSVFSQAPFGTPVSYISGAKPRGFTKLEKYRAPRADDIAAVQVVGWYKGENDAMPDSIAMRDAVDVSCLPTNDVRYRIRLLVNSKERTLDVATDLTGNGLQNYEAFITNARGQIVFLGIYVRKGTPFILMSNAGNAMQPGILHPWTDFCAITWLLQISGHNFLDNFRNAGYSMTILFLRILLGE